MVRCSICGKDNEIDRKVILVKIGNEWYCGHHSTSAIKRKVKEK